MSKCAVCRAEHNEDERERVACSRCEKRTRDDLRELVSLYGQLVGAGHTALTPGQGAGGANGGRGGTSAAERAPVRMGVLTLTGPGGVADQLQREVELWYADLSFALIIKRNAPDRCAAMATKLINNLPWAAENRVDFREFARLVASLRDRCTVALDPSKVEHRVPIGRCPADDDEGNECGSKLTADPFADHIRCRRCGTIWRRSEWMLLGSILADSA